MLFTRFAAAAREAVVVAQSAAVTEGAHRIEPRHLALGALRTAGGAARALAAAGVDLDRVGRELGGARTGTGPGGPAGADAEALAAVGIDLDAVRASVDAEFGPGAFDRAGGAGVGGDRRPGHLPFSREAKDALRHSLREADRLGSGRIDDSHVLLAVLRSGGVVTESLTREVDRPVARRALEAAASAG